MKRAGAFSAGLLFLVLGVGPIVAQNNTSATNATLRLQVTVAPVIQTDQPVARSSAANAEFSIRMDAQPVEVRQVTTDLPANERTSPAVLQTTVVLPI